SPAHVDGVITVGAYNESDTFASFSNYGPAVDILAPGENILSLSHLSDEVHKKEYILNSGTSFAAPHVAAAAALYMGYNPDATPAEVKNALLESARADILGAPGTTTNKTVYAGDFTRDKKKDKKFKLSKAKFDKKKNTMEISGEGPRHERVVVHDENGQEIARLMTGLDAKWKIVIDGPTAIPCSVSVVLNGETQAKSMEHRPASCG
ncbi:MAG: S8 family serine peptidase, partial [Rhodothermales bacterium]